MIKKIVFTFLILITLSFLISSCQEVFTYSALEDLQRDPEDLSEDEQIAYAYAAKESQKPEYMKKAFKIILPIANKYPNDKDLQFLASDLARGSAGIQSEIINTLDAFLEDDSAEGDAALEALEKAIGNVDFDDLSTSLELLERVDDDDKSDAQKVNAALTAAMLVAKANTETIDGEEVPQFDEVQAAIDQMILDGDLTEDADGVPVPPESPVAFPADVFSATTPAEQETAVNDNLNDIILYILYTADDGGLDDFSQYVGGDS